MSHMRAFHPYCFLTVLSALLAAGTAHASNLLWVNAAGGAASTAGNWSPAQVPIAIDDLTYNLNAVYTVTFNAGTPDSRTQTFRDGTVTLNMSSPHTTSAGITIGSLNGDSAIATLTSGTWNSGASVIVGNAAGSSGTLNVNDDDAHLILTGATADLTVASNAPGALNITGGGLVQVADQFVAGNNAAGTSSVTVSGATGTIPVARSTLRVPGTSQSRFGQGGDATVNISNGARAEFGGDLAIALGAASTSSVTLQGLGGLVPQPATLDVAGDLLLGRNTSAATAAGAATLNVNADGRLVVGGTLLLAGDPDGGSATLHAVNDAAITTGSLTIGDGFTLDLDGGTVDIDGGALVWNATSSSPRFNGGTGNPVITMRNGATATLSATAGGPALVVGGGGGANICDFDVQSGSELSATGSVTLGEGTDDFGRIIINDTGSTMTLPQGSTLTVGSAGDARFEAELGGSVTGDQLAIAAAATSNGIALFENLGTIATFDEVYVGGTSSGAGGAGELLVNAGGVLNVPALGSIVVYPPGLLNVRNATIDAPSVNPVVHGTVHLEGDAVFDAGLAIFASGAALHGPTDVPGVATLNARTRLMDGATLTLTDGDLTVGDPASTSGFEAQDHSSIVVGANTLTLHDQNRATVDDVTIAGGRIIAPNGLEIVTQGTNGTLTGFGTITTRELFMESGGSVITATGASGIIINGKFRNNSGLIDGTRYTFNDNPAINDSGWTGAGTIDAQVVFNTGTKIIALANMTMGDGGNFGVTFNAGSELHADTRTVTLLDGNGVGLPSVTDLNGGHVVCAQPLTVNSGRRLSGRGGSIDCPTVTINGLLSPGEMIGEPAGETGELTLNADLVLQANAATNIEIQGLLGPIQYDRVVVNGVATLDGDLNISFLNGFVPPFGSVWTVMDYESKIGDFAHINVAANSPSCVFVAVSDRAVVVSRGLPGDLDDDGDVDINDLAMLLSNFGCRGGVEFPCPIDLDFNGDTDITDLAILLSNFGQQCD